MADEHFFPVGDFPSGLGAAPFFGSGPYAPPVPPPGLESLDTAAMAPFGMLPWASEHPIPTDSAATATAHFDSALSSLVTSPAHAGCFGDDDDVAIGDLIGRLGSICNNAAASANNSCYSTPLSSPPRGASSPAGLAFRQGGHFHYPGPGAPPLEGAGGRLSRVASSKSHGAARKRKAATSGKGKARTAAANGSGSPKRPKVTGDGDTDDVAAGDAEEDTKPEPAKDYIHVRARRGQATDSHSLAERVRREKISERMKLLQSLVPGCNKITGKALMLDEIINYVQSLQRQVEFLSMKLSTMNPELDIDAQFLPASDNDAVTMMHHHQTVPLGYPDQQDPCTTGSAFYHGAGAGFGGWDAAQDELIQSVVHNQHHRHHQDQDQDQQHPDRGHGFHGT